MGGVTSKSRTKQPGVSAVATNGEDLPLTEREQQLRLQEEKIRERQAELEEWEGRLRARDGALDGQPPADGFSMVGPRGFL